MAYIRHNHSQLHIKEMDVAYIGMAWVAWVASRTSRVAKVGRNCNAEADVAYIGHNLLADAT